MPAKWQRRPKPRPSPETNNVRNPEGFRRFAEERTRTSTTLRPLEPEACRKPRATRKYWELSRHEPSRGGPIRRIADTYWVTREDVADSLEDAATSGRRVA